MVWRDFRLPVSALAKVARYSFSGKFTAKMSFPKGSFMLPLLTDIGSVKVLSTLFDKCLDMLVKFEQNRMIRRNVQNYEVFGKNWLTIFESVDENILKTFRCHNQLFDAKVLIKRQLSFQQ